MRQNILSPIQPQKASTDIQQEQLEELEVPTTVENEQESQDLIKYNLYEDLYEEEPIQQAESSLSRFPHYTFSSDYYREKLEAKISKDEAFIVVKALDKKAQISDIDNIYKVDKKYPKKKKILGYIRSSHTFKYIKYDLEHTHQLVGIANEQFPIRKHRGINQKRIGFIKLSINTDEKAEQYVEITQPRSILHMLFTILLIFTIILIPRAYNWSLSNIDTSSLPSASELQSILKQDQLIIHHKKDAVFNSAAWQIELEITSDPAESLEFQLSIHLNTGNQNQLVYESSMLEAGATLDKVPTQIRDLLPGNYTCTITCEIYKTLPFGLRTHIGTLESQFILWV